MRTENAELARLDAHFTRVLRVLNTRPPPGLTYAQRRARTRQLENLEAYRRRRLFPKNRRFPGLALPHFIDEAGTRCAMADLIEKSGAHDFVQHVARERNYARIHALAAIPELVTWLAAHGLTIDEAAAIQPEYCGTPAQSCVCIVYGNGHIQGTLTEGGATLLVTKVYNATAISVGDIVSFSDVNAIVKPGDLVFADWNAGTNSAIVRFTASANADGGDPFVVVPLSACIGEADVSSIPGPVPLAVMEQALMAGATATCSDVLVNHDSKWGELQGTGCPTGGTGGTGATGGTGGGAAGSPGGTSNLGGAGGSGAGGSSAGGFGGKAGDAGTSDAGARAGSDSSGGCDCGVVRGSALGSEAAFALSAALIVYGVRRRVRSGP